MGLYHFINNKTHKKCIKGAGGKMDMVCHMNIIIMRICENMWSVTIGDIYI